MISLLSNNKVSLLIKIYSKTIDINVYRTKILNTKNYNDCKEFDTTIIIDKKYYDEVNSIVNTIILYTYLGSVMTTDIDIHNLELFGVDYSFISKFKQLELKSKMDEFIK